MRSVASKLGTVLILGASLSCGAKTGLKVRDASVEADVDEDVFERFDACVMGRFTMVRRSAQMVFVIDRSGSMSQPLEVGRSTSRWASMRNALRAVLPEFENNLEMGAMFFPRVPNDGVIQWRQACMLTGSAGLDVAPTIRNATRITEAIFQYSPWGATPTALAIQRTAGYLRTQEARGRARYMVLATDGAPNCNGALDGSTCVCLAGATRCSSGEEGALNCLDDQGALAAIQQARMDGISTYVIGIDGDLELPFVDVLNRMAEAGGRARPRAPAYYSIREAGALEAAFTEIQRTVVSCSYVTPSRPDNPDRIEVYVGGRPVPRDPMHTSGWDWTDRDYGELTFYGDICTQVAATRPLVDAVITCGL